MTRKNSVGAHSDTNKLVEPSKSATHSFSGNKVRSLDNGGGMCFLGQDQEEKKSEEVDEVSSNSSDDSFDNLARQLRTNKDYVEETNPYLKNSKVATSKNKRP